MHWRVFSPSGSFATFFSSSGRRPSVLCSLLLSFYHQFPDLLGSPASVNLTLGAMRDPKLLLLFLCVGLTDRTVEGDQLGVNSAAAK